MSFKNFAVIRNDYCYPEFVDTLEDAKKSAKEKSLKHNGAPVAVYYSHTAVMTKIDNDRVVTFEQSI